MEPTEQKAGFNNGLRVLKLQEAASDFRYLLNRAYPRKASLELVGNRYQLTSHERHLLHRGVFSEAEAAKRRRKRVSVQKISGEELAIDAYNVIITIEAALSGRPLILAEDGFVRDISGVSGSFKRSRWTEESLRLICDLLKERRPRWTTFLFDAPISKSGQLAKEVKTLLQKVAIPGDAQAIQVPENILIGFPGIVATSDSAIIDQSKRIIDLAGFLIREKIPSAFILRFKKTRSCPKTQG